MAGKAVYTRMHTDVYERVKTHALATEQSLSAAIGDLVERGLGELSSEGRSETLEADLVSFRDRAAELVEDLAIADAERKSLQAQLKARETEASDAMAVRTHAQKLWQKVASQSKHIDDVWRYLNTAVASCNNPVCVRQLTVYDVGQHGCPNCGQWKPKWLPGFAPVPTVLEVFRDGAAVVGTAVLAAELLAALSGGRNTA